eukprot:CAMPEP_0181473934 /NCGR_PEP_ID=MMETSP1110-20121109/40383_1 /TAXON_ID=174948 /ORGANISM="Symbiodinium sp., Strain CCMP421" /LENGTH=120 /DNA_ID=CAMNT_0023599073 /DNA_START=299 /DNA_END=661 /DNA_ORIENTATION=+
MALRLTFHVPSFVEVLGDVRAQPFSQQKLHTLMLLAAVKDFLATSLQPDLDLFAFPALTSGMGHEGDTHAKSRCFHTQSATSMALILGINMHDVQAIQVLSRVGLNTSAWSQGGARQQFR